MRNRIRAVARDYLQIVVGCLITAVALDALLVPNKIAAGGVSGVGTILKHTFNVPVGLTMLLLNIPLFLMSTWRLGASFGVRTVWGALLISLFTDTLAPYMPRLAAHDPMLAALYGGGLAGIGMGLVFRAGGTTAGTDLAAALIHSYTGASVGKALFSVDFFIIASAGLVFRNAELAMYALFSMFLNSYIVDMILEGLDTTRAAFIICDQPELVAQRIMKELGRGCTGLRGQGKYTGTEREVLLCVVGRTEIISLKQIVHDEDPRAFVIMANVHEVLGEGFKQLRR